MHTVIKNKTKGTSLTSDRAKGTSLARDRAKGTSFANDSVKGTSLPMAIGLVSLLLLISVGANELIIRTIRSVQKVEASDKAYFAAEAGIEDALYELSPHFAGYQTPDLKADGVRMDDFDDTGTITWNNEWTIRSHEPTCGEEWIDNEELCGNFYENQKLIISLFNDESAPSSTLDDNAINTNIQTEDISTLSITDFSIKFRLPAYVVSENPGSFPTGLTIDNDGDMLAANGGVNEDGPDDTAICTGTISGNDGDCDGREDEDSEEDPVIYWKISDGAGHTLTPAKGCLTDTPAGSEICERDFTRDDDEVFVILDQSYTGIREDGTTQSIVAFLTFAYSETPPSKLQIEFNIVAPLEQTDETTLSKIAIPYLEYGINYTGDGVIPSPKFTIESDGYYRDFKQSITATISPKTAVPLFDFTIIQQQ